MSQEESSTTGDLLGKRRRSEARPGVESRETVDGNGVTTAALGDSEGSDKKRIRLDDVGEAVEPVTTPTISSTASSGCSASAAIDNTDPHRTDSANHEGGYVAGPSLRKRAKLDSDSDSRDRPPEVSMLSSPLLTIPPEIFSEIVLSTSSPADALSLSMTCKSLYASLSLPQSSFIWTALRRTVGRNYDAEVPGVCRRQLDTMEDEEKGSKLAEKYGMPDWQAIELENGGWKGMLFESEQEFLGFAYGIGRGAGPRKCEVCGEGMLYAKPYDSYALRVSLCDSVSRLFLVARSLAHTKLAEIVPKDVHSYAPRLRAPSPRERARRRRVARRNPSASGTATKERIPWGARGVWFF